MATKTKKIKVNSAEALTAAEKKRLKLNDAGKYPTYTTRRYNFYEKILVTGVIEFEGDWENLSDEEQIKLVKQYRKDSRVDWHDIADNRDIHVLDSFMEKYDGEDATHITGESVVDIKVEYSGLQREFQWGQDTYDDITFQDVHLS